MANFFKGLNVVDEKSDINIYYLGKELDYPIYLKMDDERFPKDALSMIIDFGFEELVDGRFKDIDAIIAKDKDSRILSMSRALPEVMRQLSRIQESDLYGVESLIPRDRYNVYRYKEGGILVFSNQANVWKLGCWTNFRDRDTLKKAYSIILNRYISWAFVNHGVAGFWGKVSGTELELLKQKESKGEAVYIDIERDIIFNLKGMILSLQGVDIVMQEKGVLIPSKKRRMVSKEELISFLCSSCTYFDLKGLNVKVRQMIARIAKTQCGYVKPKSLDGSARGLSL